MSRAYSIRNVFDAKFRTLELSGQWKSAIGDPELTGSWFIYGPPKNGKTSFAMQLAKYLSGFRRVAYNSIEEGLSLSIRKAMERAELQDEGSRIVLVRKDYEDMKSWLTSKKSPDIVFVDSVQFMEMKFSEYKQLKSMFPGKLFIYVSHVNGGLPDGYTARKIWRDSNVSFHVKAFKAFPVSRYGGGDPLLVSEERALEYWGK